MSTASVHASVRRSIQHPTEVRLQVSGTLHYGRCLALNAGILTWLERGSQHANRIPLVAVDDCTPVAELGRVAGVPRGRVEP